MITIIIIIVLILVLVFALKGNSIKGKVGESIVANILEQIPGHKRIINSIIINDNGKSRQIDHIFINECGIFIIETKNYSGNIYGKEKYEKWLQYLNNKKFEFENPIFQNYGHKQIVSKIIENDNIIIPVVVFTTRCNLKVETNKNAVIYTTQLLKFIQSQNKKLDINKIDEYYNKILEHKVLDDEVIKNHNYNVNQYVNYKEELKKEKVCPRCYGKLIIRKGKYGDFLGCSNYPKCKFTENIKR